MARGAKNVLQTWWSNVSKPNFRETSEDAPGLPLSNYTTSERQTPPGVRLPDKRVPSSHLTLHQFLYIAGSHGIGALIISGGINFALAYAMYTTTDDPIRLWQFPNTLAGDTAVTIIVQCLMTWMIEMFIVNRDLRKGNIQPIGFISEPSSTERLSRCIRWFMLLDQSKQLRKRRGSIKRKALYVLAQAVRALMVAFVSFCILFGPSVGILTAVGSKVGAGGDWVYASRWAPEIFKLVLGGVLAVMTTPFFAMFWMVKCGWNGGIHEAVMINGNEYK
ncbi:hypothetical protein KVR01_000670 [Diaporthe batatas]|uniref:uncharacterized protein n=1 Tax=Diaporthe batatas TaxID=748121 RepID=UPI001D03CC5C|nr:uncharacterized protein KVR01_000670 [Diaporthe batatas]KAG8169925.1 hypothetical protein KVR01_000670 [Diaporthe batatas]